MSVALKLKKIPDSDAQSRQGTSVLAQFVPAEILPLKDPQTDIPRIAKDKRLLKLIADSVQKIPTKHSLNLGDAREMAKLADGSVHLVLTSPPYWTLKEYRDSDGQMGHIEEYEEFLTELDKVWSALLSGARSRRAPYLRGGRRVSFAAEEQRPAYGRSAPRVDSGTLPQARIRQSGTHYLAQDF